MLIAPRFSLGAIFAAIAFVAGYAGLWIARPSWQLGFVEALLAFAVPVTALSAAWKANSHARTFLLAIALVAMAPLAGQIDFAAHKQITFVATTTGAYPILELDFRGALLACSESFRITLVAWAFAPVVGLLCVLTQRLVRSIPRLRCE